MAKWGLFLTCPVWLQDEWEEEGVGAWHHWTCKGKEWLNLVSFQNIRKLQIQQRKIVRIICV